MAGTPEGRAFRLWAYRLEAIAWHTTENMTENTRLNTAKKILERLVINAVADPSASTELMTLWALTERERISETDTST